MKSEYILLEEVAVELGKTPYSIAHMLTTKDHKLYLHVEESQESQIAISTYEGIPEHLNMYEVFNSIYPLVFESQKELILRLSQGNDDLSGLNFTDDKNKISAYFVSGCSGVTIVAKKADINTLSTPPLHIYQGGAMTGIPTVPENNFFENFEDIITYGKREPHSAFTVVARTKMKMKRADAWHQLTQLASKSNGQVEVKLPGWGFIYLKRDKLDIDKQIRHKSTIFESPNDGDAITKNAFNTAWQRATQH